MLHGKINVLIKIEKPLGFAVFGYMSIYGGGMERYYVL